MPVHDLAALIRNHHAKTTRFKRNMFPSNAVERDMEGKQGTAPCGHAGEHVIGNYVKCLAGCDSPQKQPVVKGVTTFATIIRQGAPGHGTFAKCHCFQCKIYREATYIDFYDVNGMFQHGLPWDGCALKPSFIAFADFILQTYAFTKTVGTVVSYLGGSNRLNARIIRHQRVEVDIANLIANAQP